jgi:hypothetical protein
MLSRRQLGPHPLFKIVLPLSLCLVVFLLAATSSWAGAKKGKFKGTVVWAGPKAISVQSSQNIYLVREFQYTQKLEEKINLKRPPKGAVVTVHYYVENNTAFKVH